MPRRLERSEGDLCQDLIAVQIQRRDRVVVAVADKDVLRGGDERVRARPADRRDALHRLADEGAGLHRCRDPRSVRIQADGPNRKRLGRVGITETRNLDLSDGHALAHLAGAVGEGRVLEAGLRPLLVGARNLAVLEHSDVGDVDLRFVGRQGDAEGIAAHCNVVNDLPCNGVDDDQPEMRLIHGIETRAVPVEHHIPDIAESEVLFFRCYAAVDETEPFSRPDVEDEDTVLLAAGHVDNPVVRRDGQAHEHRGEHTFIGGGSGRDRAHVWVRRHEVFDDRDRQRLGSRVGGDREISRPAQDQTEGVRRHGHGAPDGSNEPSVGYHRDPVRIDPCVQLTRRGRKNSWGQDLFAATTRQRGKEKQGSYELGHRCDAMEESSPPGLDFCRQNALVRHHATSLRSKTKGIRSGARSHRP